jgi:NAD dependent epimerase/dehydratase family
MSDTTKIRQHGFLRVEVSDIMMIRLLKEFREAAVIPWPSAVHHLQALLQISTPHKVALVVGAQGVIGRNLLDHLATLGDWNIVGPSRRGGKPANRIRHIAIDLLDRDNCREKLSDLADVTRIFYAAYQDLPTWAELVPPNLTMLTNVVGAIEAVAYRFQHISLAQEQNFRAVTSISGYAELLRVNPAALSGAVKEQTGRTAGTFIRQGILLEAQRLSTGKTPSAFRDQCHLKYSAW